MRPWIVRWTGMLIILFVAVIAVPASVNGVAYLAGAGGTITFDPLSHQTNCTQYACDTSTDGVHWTTMSTVTINLPTTIYLGLGVGSNDTTHIATAQLRGYSNT